MKLDFKDYTMKNEHVDARIHFAFLNGRHREAQQWLDRRIMLDMKPFTPYRTGNMRAHLMARNNALVGTGRLTATIMPYGKWLYHGVSRNGGMIHYTNPKTTPYWFQTAKSIYEKEWRDGVEKILKGR